MSDRIKLDPEFALYIKRLRVDVEKSLKEIIPNKKINIRTTHLQRIIANMNKDGVNIKLKKLNGKKNRYRMVFQKNGF